MKLGTDRASVYRTQQELNNGTSSGALGAQRRGPGNLPRAGEDLPERKKKKQKPFKG